MRIVRTVSLLPGDGIGPEVVRATVKVLEAMKTPVNFEVCDIGTEVMNKYGTNVPRETLESIMRNGLALKGPTGTGIGSGPASANVALRKQLDLYANLRPVKSIEGVKTRYDGVDLIVARENTHD